MTIGQWMSEMTMEELESVITDANKDAISKGGEYLPGLIQQINKTGTPPFVGQITIPTSEHFTMATFALYGYRKLKEVNNAT